jgi:adenylosuccinate lyase
MIEMIKEFKPTMYKERGVSPKTDPALLAHGRYGTKEMIEIFGPEPTFQYLLDSQAAAVKTMSKLYPEIVSPRHAEEIASKAKLGIIDPQRIREIETEKRHDIIAINTALEEKVVIEGAASDINKARASADSTETAKALQLKRALEVYINSVENLRDIVLEKAIGWTQPHMDTTHLLDALPTWAGRPLIFFGEMLQSDLDYLAYVYKHSIKGKWSDATGNHHSATTLGIDGMKLQEKYCENLGIGFMDASAQIPGREFITDVVYSMARTAATMANLAHYIRTGKGDDANIFFDASPKKRKGSSSMPHKDVKGGNPIVEEQTESYFNTVFGELVTSLATTQFDYARDLTGSASDRITLDDMFKFGDHVTRDLAQTVYHLGLNEDREKERVKRSLGLVTSEQVMTYLTDYRKTKNPMPREEAHELVASLATEAYNKKKDFVEVLIGSPKITSRLPEDTIRKITNPEEFIGQTKEIMETVFNKCHGKKTLQ